MQRAWSVSQGSESGSSPAVYYIEVQGLTWAHRTQQIRSFTAQALREPALAFRLASPAGGVPSLLAGPDSFARRRTSGILSATVLQFQAPVHDISTHTSTGCSQLDPMPISAAQPTKTAGLYVHDPCHAWTSGVACPDAEQSIPGSGTRPKSSKGHLRNWPGADWPSATELEDSNQMSVYPHRTHGDRQDRRSRVVPLGASSMHKVPEVCTRLSPTALVIMCLCYQRQMGTGLVAFTSACLWRASKTR